MNIFRIKFKKGKEKRRENYIKTEKGHTNAYFWAMNSKQIRVEGLPKKKDLEEGGGREMIEMHNIYPCIQMKVLFNQRRRSYIASK